MSELTLIQSSSALNIYKAEKQMTVKEFCKKIHLEMKFFAILIDGKKATVDSLIEPSSEITVLPKIAGG